MQEHLVVCAQLRGQLARGRRPARDSGRDCQAVDALLLATLGEAAHDQVDVDIEQERGGGAALPHADRTATGLKRHPSTLARMLVSRYKLRRTSTSLAGTPPEPPTAVQRPLVVHEESVNVCPVRGRQLQDPPQQTARPSPCAPS
eukprot:354562-Chlamydomonas_euryale.AAC.2